VHSVSLPVLALPLVLGALAAVLNGVAGGGPPFTLPAFAFAGLDPTFANRTHRVSLVLQNLAATGGSGRRRNVELGGSLKPLMLADAIFGARLHLRGGECRAKVVPDAMRMMPARLLRHCLAGG